MRMLIPIIAVLLIAAVAGAQDDDRVPLELTVDGLERTYYLHVPDHLDEPAPLVMVLHGRLEDGRSIAKYTGFSALADRERFIVAYPDGIDGEWNFVRNVPGFPNTHDDTAFLIALVDDIAASYPVDTSRVYLAGFSNGGFMVERAACENPTRFAAFATVAGAAGFGGMRQVCLEPGTVTAPILLMHGTDDSNIPWEGMSVTQGDRTVYITYPVPDTLGYWAEFNGCQPDAEGSDVPRSGKSPGTRVHILTVDCPLDASVVLYEILGGGHNWPGHEAGIAQVIAGNVNMDIDATEEIWHFFSAHQRPQDPSEDRTGD